MNPQVPKPGRIILGAAASALLLALAMPGVSWWPLLFVGLSPLLYCTLYLPVRASALTGLCSGFVYYLTQLYWIVIVLGRYGGLPLFVSLPALLLLALYMALYWAVLSGLLSYLAGRYWHRERSLAALVWTAPVLWVGLEYLRGRLFTGFPWMDLGYGLHTLPMLIQGADLGGHHLLSFCLVLTNGLVLAIFDRQRREVRLDLAAERRSLLAAAMFLVFVFGYSALRYEVVTDQARRALQAEVVVVQGNIDQGAKWTPEARRETIDTYIGLSAEALADNDAELVVWPETAMPFYVQQAAKSVEIRTAATRWNTWLLTGSPAFERITAGDSRQVRYFNSAMLIDPAGKIRATHAKQHLVPFGEYVPLQKMLFFLAPLVESVGNFTAGSSSAPLDMGMLHLGVLICYEAIFPDLARITVAKGANVLVNLTNDAWYGRSSAPWQSMAMTVLRAVENKRSLVRAANSGISGFVDPAGNIMAATDLFTRTAVRAQVPLLEKQTVFERGGHHFGAACLALILPLVLFRRR
ncbi:MAG: apolipoprotein N-acyltransferase [Desulfobulbus propionicus]|nr:MAG: apolipoprotein N-acyltransferase [Desulfobulbus propionicus]